MEPFDQDPDAAAAVALRQQLQEAQKDLSAITAQKAKVEIPDCQYLWSGSELTLYKVSPSFFVLSG
jgi:hypothetical protein